LDDDSKRNLEDDEDAGMEMPEDYPHLEWCEEVGRKAKEEEDDDEMLEEQEALLESFAAACKEQRTRAAVAHAIRVESSPRRPGHVPACLQFLVGRFAEVARIWKAIADRRKAFDDDASCSANGECTAATGAIVVISSDEEE
jgi:hypothetical protein